MKPLQSLNVKTRLQHAKQHTQLRALLPEICDEIRMFAEVLPGGTASPAYPFSGFVVNFNVCTKVHRDGKDLAACLVMPIGTFTGGDLVLVEPGLVIPLRSGDVIIFPSCRISHFNLHYIGRRASLVCHTDREGTKWVNDHLGWSRHPDVA